MATTRRVSFLNPTYWVHFIAGLIYGMLFVYYIWFTPGVE
jgi:hypothetical protein